MSNSAGPEVVVTFPMVEIAELYAAFEQALMDGDDDQAQAMHEGLREAERRLCLLGLTRKQGG